MRRAAGYTDITVAPDECAVIAAVPPRLPHPAHLPPEGNELHLDWDARAAVFLDGSFV